MSTTTTTKTRNNWEPVIKSLCKQLQEAGCVLTSSDNGEFETKVPEGASKAFARRLIAYNANACDEARIYVTTPDGRENGWVYVVLGNEPWETASDYTCRPEIEAACDRFAEIWEERKCPQMPADAPYATTEPTR